MAWNILYLPAIDPETGASLWPEYFPLEFLEKKRAEMGGPLFKCMYLGDPAGLTGDIFQAEWFKLATLRWEPVPDGSGRSELQRVLYPDGRAEPVPWDRLLIYQFWDLAISEKETADYTTCVTLALLPEDMSLYVVDVFRDHLSFKKTQEKMAQLAEFWRPHAIGIESVAYQAAAVQEARNRLLFAITETKVDRDKVTRSRLPASLAENGKIWVVRQQGLDAFFDELVGFPTGPHDDQVDALSGAAALAQAYVPSSFFLFG